MMPNPPHYEASLKYARHCDSNDPLQVFRSQFHLPRMDKGDEQIYFCGNSLGLQSRGVRVAIERELDDWERLGVEGHFHAQSPWLRYHSYLTASSGRLVGALPHEVVTMNSLTVNLHLLMVSFYQPLPHRYKILIEANAFPSDRYAVMSQLKFHQLDPVDGLLELPLRRGEMTHRPEDILSFIKAHGEEIALVMLSGVNYYSGQVFDISAISSAAHDQGCRVGWDLAHAAGNIALRLHDWDVDFATWCTYKYLNSGPGGLSGVFVHERHGKNFSLPRFAGWWGNDPATRFEMKPHFQPSPGAEGWQISNQPILPMAALRASLELFDKAGMDNLRNKSEQLTGFLAFLVKGLGKEKVRILTPNDPLQRGCQLSLVLPNQGRVIFDALSREGVICDWREPDVIRVAPVPLYNTFEEVFRFYEILQKLL